MPIDPPKASPSSHPGLEDATFTKKKLKSPTNSIEAGDRTISLSRKVSSEGNEIVADFRARPSPRTRGRIWNERDPVTTRQTSQPRSHPRPKRRLDHEQVTEDENPTVNTMIGRPETRPIPREQLVPDAKGINAGAIMVESICIGCIEVDNPQRMQSDPDLKINNGQWQALITLHRALLHEHHDFFLASQHPSARTWSQRPSPRRRLTFQHRDLIMDKLKQNAWLQYGNFDNDRAFKSPILRGGGSRLKRETHGVGLVMDKLEVQFSTRILPISTTCQATAGFHNTTWIP